MNPKKTCPSISVALCFAVLTGCASIQPDEVVTPKDVTVQKALEDIGKGFSAMKRELDRQVLGVYPCVIKVSLNLKASAVDSGKLIVDATTKPRILEGMKSPVTPAVKAQFESGGTSSAERGNTIAIEMYSPGCLPKGTLGYQKPEHVASAQRGMAATGAEPMGENDSQKVER